MKNLRRIIVLSCLVTLDSLGTSLDALSQDTIGNLMVKIGEFKPTNEYRMDFATFIVENNIEPFYVFLENDDIFSSKEDFLNALIETCSGTKFGESIIQDFCSIDEFIHNRTSTSGFSSNSNDLKYSEEGFTYTKPSNTSVEMRVSLFDDLITRNKFAAFVTNLQNLNDEVKYDSQSVHRTSSFFVQNDKFILNLADEILKFYDRLATPANDILAEVNSLNIHNNFKNKYVNALLNNSFDRETQSNPRDLFITSYKLSELICDLAETLNEALEGLIKPINDQDHYNLKELTRNIEENYTTQGGCVPGICNRLKGHICKCLVWFYNHTQALKMIQ